MRGSITRRPDPHARIVTLHKRILEQTKKGFGPKDNFNHTRLSLSSKMAGGNVHTMVFLDCTSSFALPIGMCSARITMFLLSARLKVSSQPDWSCYD